MLVLSRAVRETIVITAPDGTRITLTVNAIFGEYVSLGITAPRNWPVHRGEVQRRVDSETAPGIGEDYA